MSDSLWDFIGSLMYGAVWAVLAVTVVGLVNLVSASDPFDLYTASAVAFGLSSGEYMNRRRLERKSQPR